jgi:N6-L-threonylcarbamoyladenine synthase
MELAIGIDTSCYTTSVAALNVAGLLLADARIPLQVKPGGKGLAQSEMIFQHVRNLPVVMERLRRAVGQQAQIVGVGVSIRPRPVDSSYMPVFLAGLGVAKSVGAALDCPVYEISHQENHLLAGLWSAQMDESLPFLAIHASGGTTEILKVSQDSGGLAIELLGGSGDLNAGQFIDRIGVALGLSFPAGPALEKLAEQAGTDYPVTPPAVNGLQISFSGPESHVKRWLAKNHDPAAVAASVQRCVAESLSRALTMAIDRTGISRILLVGGVAANLFVRSHVSAVLQQSRQAEVRWPAAEFSGDNAAGAAWWALRQRTV